METVASRALKTADWKGRSKWSRCFWQRGDTGQRRNERTTTGPGRAG